MVVVAVLERPPLVASSADRGISGRGAVDSKADVDENARSSDVASRTAGYGAIVVSGEWLVRQRLVCLGTHVSLSHSQRERTNPDFLMVFNEVSN